MGGKKYFGPVAAFLFRLEGYKFRLESTEISVERQLFTTFSVEIMPKFRLKWRLSSKLRYRVPFSDEMRKFPLKFRFEGLFSENFG